MEKFKDFLNESRYDKEVSDIVKKKYGKIIFKDDKMWDTDDAIEVWEESKFKIWVKEADPANGKKVFKYNYELL